MSHFKNRVDILNISINNISLHTLLTNLKQGGMVYTVNVDHLSKLQKDAVFYQVYVESDYVVCDSKILMWVANFLGTPLREKISGSDLFPAFYQFYKDDPEMTIFLLGAAEGVAAKAQANINAKMGRKIVIDCYSPPLGFEKDPQECQKIIDLINQSQATVLAVGLGAPKQEKWLYLYRDQFRFAKVFLAIGATIDFEAGNLKRSPKWMSQFGLEWLYRLLSEPQRLWKRYLVESIPVFWHILQQKFNLYRYHQPLGLTLKEAGLLSLTQIKKVLNQQVIDPQQRFGDIVVDYGWLSRKTVDFFADRMPNLYQQIPRNLLGAYLKEAGLLHEAQIEIILTEQKPSGLMFGEIAVQKGWVKQETVDLLVEPTLSQSRLKEFIINNDQ